MKKIYGILQCLHHICKKHLTNKIINLVGPYLRYLFDRVMKNYEQMEKEKDPDLRKAYFDVVYKVVQIYHTLIRVDNTQDFFKEYMKFLFERFNYLLNVEISEEDNLILLIKTEICLIIKLSMEKYDIQNCQIYITSILKQLENLNQDERYKKFVNASINILTMVSLKNLRDLKFPLKIPTKQRCVFCENPLDEVWIDSNKLFCTQHCSRMRKRISLIIKWIPSGYTLLQLAATSKLVRNVIFNEPNIAVFQLNEGSGITLPYKNILRLNRMSHKYKQYKIHSKHRKLVYYIKNKDIMDSICCGYNLKLNPFPNLVVLCDICRKKIPPTMNQRTWEEYRGKLYCGKECADNAHEEYCKTCTE